MADTAIAEPQSLADMDRQMFNEHIAPIKEHGLDGTPPAGAPPSPLPQPAPAPAAQTPPAPAPEPAKQVTAPPLPSDKPKSADEKAYDDMPKKADGSIDFEAAPEPRTPSDWKRYKGARAWEQGLFAKEKTTFQQQLAETQRKVEEAAKAPPKIEVPADVAEQLKGYQDEIAKLHQAFIAADIKSDPKFIEYFDAKAAAVKSEREASKNELVAALGDDKGKRLLEIHALPDGAYKKSQLDDFLGELTPSEQGDVALFRQSIRDVSRKEKAIDDEQKAEISKSEKLRSERQAQKLAQTATAQQTIEKTWTTTIAKLQDAATGFGPIKLRPDDPAGNKAAQTRVDNAKALLLGKNVTPETAILAAVYAASLPDVVAAAVQESEAKDKEIAGLKGQIAALGGAQPGGGLPSPLPGKVESHQAKYKPDTKPWEADVADFEAMKRQVQQGM